MRRPHRAYRPVVRHLCMCALLCCVIAFGGHLQAQETERFRHADAPFHTAVSLYERAVYGGAKSHFQSFLTSDNSGKSEPLVRRAELYVAQCALRLSEPEAEYLYYDFIDRHSPDPLIETAALDLGDFYYDQRRYDQAIAAYAMISPDNLSEEQASEWHFKKGYSHFVRKDFMGAEHLFHTVKDIRNRYYYPVNYYYGMCNYFDGDFDEAVRSFERIAPSTKYQPRVPYYISQIYFAQGRYDRLTTYAEQEVKRPLIENKKEIHQLLGQTYFVRGQYEKALPHLEYYEAHSRKLTPEEFYQLAFTQYRLEYYDRAIPNFLELANQASEMGQNSNYYLADCYLRKGDKNAARLAFRKVSQLPHLPKIRQEAQFNFAKLSAELSYDTEAMNALRDIEQHSPFYLESQALLTELLLRTRDYASAITVLESVPQMTMEMEKTYQQVNLYRGIQLYNDGAVQQAESRFKQSLNVPIDKSLVARSLFWLGTIWHNRGDYTKSLEDFENYFYTARRIKNLPEASAAHMAHYTQAYNYLKLARYEEAGDEFRSTIRSVDDLGNIRRQKRLTQKVYGDALIRLGDCLFKQNAYADALTSYDRAISGGYGGGAYALFQKAQVEGLMAAPFDKILTLEELIEAFPKSSLTDDALLQLGDTYLSMGNTSMAQPAFERIISDFSQRSNLLNRAYLKLGLISYNQGDAEQALEYYKAIFDHNPNAKETQEAVTAIEEIYVEDLGRSQEFIRFLETVPGFDLSDFSKDSLSFAIAENQFKNGNYHTAIKGFNTYVSEYPRGAYRIQSLYLRAEALATLKNYTQALVDYRAVVDLGISDYYGDALNKAALISYNHTEDFELAFSLYQRLLELATDADSELAALLGIVRSAARTEQHDAVITNGLRIIDHDKATIPEVRHMHYLLGHAYMATSALDNAWVHFDSAARGGDDQEAAEARYQIAAIQAIQKNWTEAEAACKTAIRQSTSYPFWVAKALLLLSDVYVQTDQLFKARAALETIAENYQGDESILAEATQKLKALEALEKQKTRVREERPSDTLEMDHGQ